MAEGLNLNTRETAARLHVSLGTLANWRTTGSGPRYIKWGKIILYPVRELDAFEAKHLHTSTHCPVVK